MKKLVFLMLSVMVFTSCFAQRANRRASRDAAPVEAAAQEAPTEPGVVTEECIINMSLFNESARNRQFADALEPWNMVFEQCPSANRVIYTQGRLIVQWELSQQKDDASYKKVFDKLMKLYDMRMKYFGDDERFPTAWIKGVKALDYLAYAKNEELYLPAYKWMDESIAGMGNNSEIEVLRSFMVLSDKLFAADNSHAEKYIQDYLRVISILDVMASDPQNSNAELAAQYKNGIEVLFAQSGAANCETLDKLYAVQVNENLNNASVLNRILSFYRRVRCIDSEVFLKAAVASHRIEPTAESANALGAMAFNRSEFQKAIDFFDEASRLTESNDEKSDLQLRIAQIYFSRLNNFQRTKTHANNAISFRPNNANAYLLIGLAYASARGIYSDEILNKSVYWAAVDKFTRARQLAAQSDPALVEEATRLINTYSRFFPTKEEIFMHPELVDGRPFFVGGWIGENTTVR